MSESKINSTSNFEVSITLKLTEVEARALGQLTVYGTPTFLKVFYEKLGKSYLQPHEKGIISLFETIRKELPQHIAKADKARKVYYEK